MSEWVALFKGDASEAERLIERLGNRDVRSRSIVDRRRVSRKLRSRPPATTVEIQREDLELASAVRDEWALPRAGRAAERLRRSRRILVAASLAPVLWLCAYALDVPGTPRPDPVWLVGIWIAGAVVIGQMERKK